MAWLQGQPDESVDLLITDIGLPGLNGRQLADAARVQRPGLPVLFMTGYAENAEADKWTHAGTPNIAEAVAA